MGKREELKKKYPNVPVEAFDIEESDELAELYCEMFGYE